MRAMHAVRFEQQVVEGKLEQPENVVLRAHDIGKRQVVGRRTLRLRTVLVKPLGSRATCYEIA